MVPQALAAGWEGQGVTESWKNCTRSKRLRDLSPSTPRHSSHLLNIPQDLGAQQMVALGVPGHGDVYADITI